MAHPSPASSIKAMAPMPQWAAFGSQSGLGSAGTLSPNGVEGAPAHVHLAAREAARAAVASGAPPGEVVSRALAAAQAALGQQPAAHAAPPLLLLSTTNGLGDGLGALPSLSPSRYGLESEYGSDRPSNLRGSASSASDLHGPGGSGAAKDRHGPNGKRVPSKGGRVSASSPSPRHRASTSASGGEGHGSGGRQHSCSPRSPPSDASKPADASKMLTRRSSGRSPMGSPAPTLKSAACSASTRASASPSSPPRSPRSPSSPSSPPLPASPGAHGAPAGASGGPIPAAQEPNAWQKVFGGFMEGVRAARPGEADSKVEPKMAAVVREAVAHERLYQKHQERLQKLEAKRREVVRAVGTPSNHLQREFTANSGPRGGGGFSFGSQSRATPYPERSPTLQAAPGSGNTATGLVLAPALGSGGSSGSLGGGCGDGSGSGASPGAAVHAKAASVTPPSGGAPSRGTQPYAATGLPLSSRQGLTFTSTVLRETPGPGAYDTATAKKRMESGNGQPTSAAFVSRSSRNLPWPGSPDGARDEDGSAAGAKASPNRKPHAPTKCCSDTTTPGPGAYTPPSSFAAAAAPRASQASQAQPSAWARDREPTRRDLQLEALEKTAPSPLHYSPSRAFCS